MSGVANLTTLGFDDMGVEIFFFFATDLENSCHCLDIQIDYTHLFVHVRSDRGDVVGESNESCPLRSSFDVKKLMKRSSARFCLPYVSPRQAVFKLIVQGGSRNK